MKKSYFVIPTIVLIVAFLGSSWVTSNLYWYETIILPSLTPAAAFFSLAWTIIYFCVAISAIIVWNKFPRKKIFDWIIALFAANAFLNVFWTYLFFELRFLDAAFIDAVFLTISLMFLLVLVGPRNRAGVLLYPYLIWAIFATYLSYGVWQVN